MVVLSVRASPPVVQKMDAGIVECMGPIVECPQNIDYGAFTRGDVFSGRR